MPAEAVAIFERALASLAETVASFEEGEKGRAWRLAAYLEAPPDLGHLATVLQVAAAATGIPPPEPKVTRLAECDWVRESERQRPPVRAGRFFIHGAHGRGLAPAGALALEIEAGRAFGSGAHPTTAACLLALDRLSRRRRFRRPLDLGTGSGVLALAMIGLWKVPVVASDSDPLALDVARGNARKNRLSPFLRTVAAEGFRHPAFARASPFDLVVANLYARPLRALAEAMAGHLGRGGVLVLSGLLVTQEREVLNRYREAGFALLHRLPVAEWMTLVLVKGALARPGRSA